MQILGLSCHPFPHCWLRFSDICRSKSGSSVFVKTFKNHHRGSKNQGWCLLETSRKTIKKQHRTWVHVLSAKHAMKYHETVAKRHQNGLLRVSKNAKCSPRSSQKGAKNYQKCRLQSQESPKTPKRLSQSLLKAFQSLFGRFV